MHISKEFKVGILAIVSIAILYFGFNFLKGIDFLSTNNTYYVIYDNIGGLKPSNPIIINGYSVGLVGDITLLQDQGNSMLVTLEIDSDVKLGKGTIAKLTSTGLMGGKAIELEMGPEAQAYYQDGDTLSAVKDKELEAQLEKTIGGLNKLLDSLSGTTTVINATLNDFQSTSATVRNTIEKNQGNIQQTFRNLKMTTDSLNYLLSDVKTMVNKTSTFADTLNNLQLSQTLDKAQLMMDNINKSMEAIANQEGSLGKLVHDDSLYTNLNRAVADLDSLFIDLKDKPGRYVHFSLFGKKNK